MFKEYFFVTESIYLSNGIDILNCNAKNIIQKYIRKGNYHET